MINPDFFSLSLKKAGYEFVAGVPDSLLKELCKNFYYTFGKKHIISTNEGSAVALAIGHYLGRGKPAVVYLQNSGLGNIVNPITSLASPKVYGIPMLLIIGWRGEIIKRQVLDEPQHKMQGLITLEQLKILKIPFRIINSKTKNIRQIINSLKIKSIMKQAPVAIVVRKKTFSKTKYKDRDIKKYKFNREEAINEILSTLKGKNNIIVSTTGMTSRELYELRIKKRENLFQDFLTVGGMGHASQIASGLAMTTQKKVICIDGDGALLMHAGALGISSKINNLIHILINNKAHDSVGGQPTLGVSLDFKKISKNFGYRYVFILKKKKNVSTVIKKCLILKKSCMVIMTCDKGYRKNLGRPEKNMKLRKEKFIKYINSR